jgi:hypothetical protein
MLREPVRLASCLAATIVATSCAPSTFLETVVSTAYRPPRASTIRVPASAGAGVRLLAGDMHCHVSPPDGFGHVVRGLDETVRLARREGLDFVVLSPHLRSTKLLDDLELAEEIAELRALLADLARLATPAAPLFVTGIEYTDFDYGHAVLAFGDIVGVLEEVAALPPPDRPVALFQRWIDRRGLVVIAHPLLTGVPSFLPPARTDLSWTPITSRGPVPPELVLADRRAQAFEAFNVNIAALRDRFLFHDEHQTMEDTLRLFDVRMRSRRTRWVPVGSSDSHVGSMRAATWVLARARTPEAIRDAIAAGKVCIRSPEACTFEVRAPGGRWHGVGAELGSTRTLEVRADHDDLEVFVDGRRARRGPGIVALPAGCSIVRARVDEGWSGVVTVGCGTPP